MKIEKKMTIGQLCEMDELSPLNQYFFTKMTDDVWENSLEYYGFEKCGFREALGRLEELAALEREKRSVVYDIYSEKERDAEPDKRAVKLIYMPGENDRPYVLICPGGAYARQWGLIEGLAVGARLNRMGYSAFVLYYRTKQKPPFSASLMPKPMEDLARAVDFIGGNAGRLKVRKEGYAVAGFSAGGHLAAEWGTTNHGWRVFGKEPPAALFLAYPSISTNIFYDNLERISESDRESVCYYLSRMNGESFTREGLQEYNIKYHMDGNYPPVYLSVCEDDAVVPVSCSYLFLERLKDLQIPYKARIGKTGGHSFGVGDKTEVDGWIEEAVKFWENVNRGLDK